MKFQLHFRSGEWVIVGRAFKGLISRLLSVLYFLIQLAITQVLVIFCLLLYVRYFIIKGVKEKTIQFQHLLQKLLIDSWRQRGAGKTVLRNQNSGQVISKSGNTVLGGNYQNQNMSIRCAVLWKQTSSNSLSTAAPDRANQNKQTNK